MQYLHIFLSLLQIKTRNNLLFKIVLDEGRAMVTSQVQALTCMCGFVFGEVLVARAELPWFQFGPTSAKAKPIRASANKRI